MILEQLTLKNFCLYHGEQVFDLRPSQKRGKHLPIILFGGMNGGGKTTLLDAIQLALYGNRAKCSKRVNLPYEEFLRACVHHGAEEGAITGVTLSFRYAVDGEEHLYDVSRTWRGGETRLKEDLCVSQDGLPDQWFSDNWQQLVEDLFPLDISQLFFFDAEKIRTLAEDDSSSKALGAAIKALLGLDIVERLITDSSVLQNRLIKRAGTPEQQAQVEAIEKEILLNQEQVDHLKSQKASLENHRLRAEVELKEAEEEFAAGGGKHWEAKQERDAKLREILKREEEYQCQLVELASGELPLLQVSELLKNADKQNRKERQASESGVIEALLKTRDKQLIKVLKDAEGTASLVEKVTQFLEEDRETRQENAKCKKRLELSESTHHLLEHLLKHKLRELSLTAKTLLKKHRQALKDREDLERAVTATPDENDIQRVLERFKNATQDFAHLEGQSNQLEATILINQKKIDDLKEKLTKLWHGKLDREFAQEDAGRMAELACKTRDIMNTFLIRVTERKIDRLSSLITESFRFLLRKQSLVERIIIEPDTFAITLYDSTGLAISKQRLSEGEKQIFAISVLWGLARASSRPLPAVIDTPMARLDGGHRKYLVERYFPNASHQVVIFSTDTEVDREYYEQVRPHIARAYHLNYDEDHRRTTGEQGYFWKDEALMGDES